MDPRRRLFLRGSIRAVRASELPIPLRPPWALDDDARFQLLCSRCDACAEACPHGLLLRGDGGYPTISFAKSGCDRCGKCLSACKTGALSTAMDGQPIRWHVKVENSCLAQRKVECRICADACEPRALRFAIASGGVMELRIDPATCNGCGECVSTCPVDAITMAIPTSDAPKV